MYSYKMSGEEKEYLSKYNMNDYERPSIAADIAIFSILDDGQTTNIRKLQKKSLKILLIQRATYPYKDCWALPGGFCVPSEDVRETAKRELYEETNVENAFLQLVDVFGEKDRDPRGWIISNTFMALMDGEKCSLRAGTDAWKARWFRVEVEANEVKRNTKEEEIKIETEYELKLINEEENIVLTSAVKEKKRFCHYHETVHYEMTDNEGLAFDHGKIILAALLSLRKDVEQNSMIAFDLMPERFTLTQLQKAIELVLDQQLTGPNFRRKIKDFVVETEEMSEGGGYRPAKLFKRNVEAFYR